MYCILSLDGGGIRGILTAQILNRLVEAQPDFLDAIDLFAGTSAGAINAAALAIGKTPLELVALYQDESRQIFHREPFGNLGLLESRYNSAGRKTVLQGVYGNLTLGQIQRKVLIASFQLDAENPNSPAGPNQPHSWKPKFFHNFPNDNDGTPNSDDLKQTLVDVVMRSSAAPTYFPIYQGYVDGGVVVNNPSMAALAQALNGSTGKEKSTDTIRLLSIGTGNVNENLKVNAQGDEPWGLTQWGIKLLDIVFDGSTQIADYQCSQLLAKGYVRVQPDLKAGIALDDTDAIKHLIDIANSADISSAVDLIKSNDWKKT